MYTWGYCIIFLSSSELKAQVSFSDRLSPSSVRPSVCKLFLFSTYSQEPLGQFQPNLAQSILQWVMGIQVCSNELGEVLCGVDSWYRYVLLVSQIPCFLLQPCLPSLYCQTFLIRHPCYPFHCYPTFFIPIWPFSMCFTQCNPTPCLLFQL